MTTFNCQRNLVDLRVKVVIVRFLVRCSYYRSLVVVSLGKTLNANFLTRTLWVVEDQHRFLFHNGIYLRKKLNKEQARRILPFFHVGLGNNCLILNIYDVNCPMINTRYIYPPDMWNNLLTCLAPN